MTAPTAQRTRDRARTVARRHARRHGWTVAVWGLLVAMIAWYTTLIPEFGSFQISSIAKNSLPAVLLALGQAVIVLSRGIDVGIGALMVLGNSMAAKLMEGQPFAMTVLIALAVMAGAAVLNGLVGWIIVISRVPDVVVTLATLFVFSGLALLVLPSPGGGTSPGLRFVFTGSEVGVGTNYWPSVLALAIPTMLLAWWLTRTRQGLALYAIGSDTGAAFLSGVNVTWAKIRSYAVGGAFAGLAGVALIAISNSGDPRFANAVNGTLNSLAAVVVGGVLLGGGVGSVIGATAAGIVLFTLDPILTAMGIDPNTAQIVRGVLIVVVMMAAGLFEWRRRRYT